MTRGSQLAGGQIDENIRRHVQEAMWPLGRKDQRAHALDELGRLDDDQASTAYIHVSAAEKRTVRWRLSFIAISVAVLLSPFFGFLQGRDQHGERSIVYFISYMFLGLSMIVGLSMDERTRMVCSRICRKSTLDRMWTQLPVQELGSGGDGIRALWKSIGEVLTDMNRSGDPISQKTQLEITRRLKAYWPTFWRAKEPLFAAQVMLDPSRASQLDQTILAPLCGLLTEVGFDQEQRQLQKAIREAFLSSIPV